MMSIRQGVINQGPFQKQVFDSEYRRVRQHRGRSRTKWLNLFDRPKRKIDFFLRVASYLSHSFTGLMWSGLSLLDEQKNGTILSILHGRTLENLYICICIWFSWQKKLLSKHQTFPLHNARYTFLLFVLTSN